MCNEDLIALPVGMKIGVSYVMLTDDDYKQIIENAKPRFISDAEEDDLKRKAGAGSISEEEYTKLYEKLNPFWISLREAYPGLSSCNQVSRVGFNIVHTQALVDQVCRRSDGSSWSGLVFLKKVDGRWIIDITSMFTVYYPGDFLESDK